MQGPKKDPCAPADDSSGMAADGPAVSSREGGAHSPHGASRPLAAAGGARATQAPPLDGQQAIYGALDLGTNNCRLLVARPARRGFYVVDAFSRIIRLGEGVATSGRLSDVAMERTLEALKVCADKLERQRVERSRLIATEACRVAANGGEFLDRVHGETGLRLEIISRESEARLAVSGCASLIDQSADLVLVFDIGGGSSELIWLDFGRHRNGGATRVAGWRHAERCIESWTSLPVGVVTLAERFGGCAVTPDVFESMVDAVLALLHAFEAQRPQAGRMRHRRTHMLGTSGTVTTVAGIHLGLKRYDRRRVDGCWLSAASVRRVSSHLLGLSYEERVLEPCIGKDRADLVLAGCAILEALLRKWPCDRLRVADRGLREGILATLMAEDGVLGDQDRGSSRGRWNGARGRR